MVDNGKILIVDDDEDVLMAARFLLKGNVGVVHTESKPESIPTLLCREGYDVILLDMNFSRDVASGQEGLHWLGRVLGIDPKAVVIMITAFADVSLAVQAIKAGATDFVVKPWQNEKLLATVSAALELRRSRQEAQVLKNRQRQLASDLDHPFQNFIATSRAMQEVVDTIQRVAATDANVLIVGENGTGKEVVARALHRKSARADAVFVTVDMGAVSDSLFESELFGYVRGSFTDARSDRAGRFETASGGTLFLDEIGNLPLRSQSKLLTALEQRSVIRIGSAKAIPIDIRLICATNLPAAELSSSQRFRQDLLYRINTVQIVVPPLRQRVEDIAPLAQYYLKLYASKYLKSHLQFSAGAIKRLEEYGWPGNVRELQHAVERAVILSDGRSLTPADFPFTLDAEESAEAITVKDYDLERIEKTVIRKALTRHNGNISQTARELGLTRTALYRRMQKYGL